MILLWYSFDVGYIIFSLLFNDFCQCSDIFDSNMRHDIIMVLLQIVEGIIWNVLKVSLTLIHQNIWDLGGKNE